jgi:hypothetical protein
MKAALRANAKRAEVVVLDVLVSMKLSVTFPSKSGRIR